MKRRRITVMWMPSVSSKSRTISFPSALLYLFVLLLLVSWVVLATGGYFGNRLYRDYLELREENFYLLEREKELEALRQAMERIQEDENTIRNFLGLDRSEGGEGGLGQGGEPLADLSSIAPSDAVMSSSMLRPTNPGGISTLYKARRLATNLQELVESMRGQREIWDSTPSIIPVAGTDYWFSSGFGWRRSPFTGLKEFHNGLDISSRKGTPIVAPADGVVIKTGKDKYLGKYIHIKHGQEIITIYGHLSRIDVTSRQKVKRGDVIALMGNTGLSTGHHLHYMVKVEDKCVNPLHYMLNAARDNHLFALPPRAEGGQS